MGAGGLKALSILCVLFYNNYVFAQGPPPGGADGPPDGPSGVEFGVFFTSAIAPSPDEQSQSFADLSMVETTQMNETTAIVTGPFILKMPFDSNLMLEVQLLKETNGKMDAMMTLEICDVCSEFGREDGEYYKFLQYLDFPVPCPVPPGEYQIKNMVCDVDPMLIKSSNAGCYLSLMKFKKTDGTCKDDMEYVASLQLAFCIEPI